MDYRFLTDIKYTNELKEYFGKHKQKIERSNDKHCILCGKDLKNKSYCPSHSIPHFVLDYLQENGRALNMNSLLHNDMFWKEEVGKKNALIFYSLCHECDNHLFKCYEDENIYKNMLAKDNISQEILYGIKLKNILYEKYIDEVIIEMLKFSCRKCNKNIDIHFNERKNRYLLQSINNHLDYKKKDLFYANRTLNLLKDDFKEKNKKFKIGYFKRLNYKIDFAIQRDIYLIHDTQWNVMNDVYNDNNDLEPATFVVFPFYDFSIIIIFVEEGNLKYDGYFKQLSNLDIKSQLKWIVFNIFTMSQDVLLNSNLTEHNKKSLKELAAHNDSGDNVNMVNRINALKKLFNSKFYYFYKG